MSKISNQPVRLSLEAFEERANPSAYVTLDSAGNLFISSGEGSDVVSVRYQSGSWSPYGYYRPAKLVVTANGVDTAVNASGVTGYIKYIGGGGNDRFTNDTGWRVLAYGGADNDTLTGGTGDDTLEGGSGNDFLNGREGSDRLKGQDGLDTLWGSTGVDYLDGGIDAYSDELYGHGNQDWFARDMRGWWTPTWSYSYNADAARDYNPSEGDSYYDTY